MRHLPEPIQFCYTLNGKLFAVTTSQTYRVRTRKRWRDKNKAFANMALFSNTSIGRNQPANCSGA